MFNFQCLILNGQCYLGMDRLATWNLKLATLVHRSFSEGGWNLQPETLFRFLQTFCWIFRFHFFHCICHPGLYQWFLIGSHHRIAMYEGLGFHWHITIFYFLPNFLEFLVLSPDGILHKGRKVQFILTFYYVIIKPPGNRLNVGIPRIMGGITMAIVTGNL